MTSRNVSKTGSAAGIVVKPQKETTLKVMPVPIVQGKLFCVLNHQSRNLLTTPRINRNVNPNLGYEPGHLGVREKNWRVAEKGQIHNTLLGYLFKVTTYKFEITAIISITNILLTWRAQFMEIGCQEVQKWKQDSEPLHTKLMYILRVSAIIRGSLSTVHGASSGCGWRKCLKRGGELRIYSTFSRGQPTRGGPPAWKLGEVLKPPHPKYSRCYKIFHIISD